MRQIVYKLFKLSTNFLTVDTSWILIEYDSFSVQGYNLIISKLKYAHNIPEDWILEIFRVSSQNRLPEPLAAVILWEP